MSEGTRKGNGVPFERRWGIVYTVRSNQVLRLHFFTTREDALKAAGLEE
jgi:hypothetical protein